MIMSAYFKAEYDNTLEKLYHKVYEIVFDEITKIQTEEGQ